MATNTFTGTTFRIRTIISDPTKYFAILAALLFILLFVIYPTIMVILEPAADHWVRFFSTARYRTILMNSLVMALLSTMTATIIGFCFSYALSRDDFPFKKFFRLVSFLPLVSPPFVAGLSLILLLGRRGIITYGLLGLDISIYGLPGLLIAQTIAYYPIAAVSLSGVLKGIDPTLEYAAQDLGQSRWGIFRTVTLPLAIPGIASAALLVSMMVLSDFGNPMVIGGPFRVLATEAYMQVVGLYNIKMGAVISFVLLVPSLVVFIVQRYWLSRRQYVTVRGRGGGLSQIPTSAPVKWFLVIFLGCISLFVILIFIVIIWGAFAKTWGLDWSLTLENFQYTLMARTRDIWNSVWFSAVAGICTAVFAVISSYVIHRKQFAGRRALDFFVVLPAALPGTLIGIAYIVTFNTPPIILTGTAAIIIISFMIRNIPVGYRSSLSALYQIDESIEESAADSGANTFMVLKDIILPLVKSAFTATIVYTFIRSINSVSTVIFLISARTNVATTSILGLAEHGYWGQAAAMATLLMAITLSVLGIFRLLGGKRLFDI